MKSQTLISVLVAAAFVGGCQAVKESGNGISKSFRQSGKQFVQQKLDEWIALAGVEVQWNHVLEKFQRQGVGRALLGKDKHGHLYEGYVYCNPSPSITTERSRESVNSKNELIRIAQGLGWAVAKREGDADRERYQLYHESNKWALARWREAGLRLSHKQHAGMFCGLQWAVRRYKQHNPGQQVDANVLKWFKDNYLRGGWECR